MKRNLNIETTKGNQHKSQSGVTAAHTLKPAKPETMDVTEPANISAIALELTSDEPVETLEASKAAQRPLEVTSGDPVLTLEPSKATPTEADAIKQPITIIHLLKGILGFLQSYENKS